MSDDLLPGGAPPAPPAGPLTAPPRASRARIQCSFCECELDPEGAVLRRGAAAGEYLNLQDDIRKLKETLALRDEELQNCQRQLTEARTAPKRKGFLD